MVTDTLVMRDVRYRPGTVHWQLSIDMLAVRTGECTGIIGPNGAGKSTLLRIAAGILKPDRGTVSIGGHGIESLDRRQIARTLGYLPQQNPDGGEQAVRSIVSLGRYPYISGAGFLSPHDTSVIDECMEITETDLLASRDFKSLSGGERQRVLLASILAQEPDVLLLDEPASALDLHHKGRFFALLSELAARGLAVVTVTHDINTAAAFCDRLIVMNRGGIIGDGSPEAVLTPEILGELYGDEVGVARNPHTGSVAVYLTGARDRRPL